MGTWGHWKSSPSKGYLEKEAADFLEMHKKITEEKEEKDHFEHASCAGTLLPIKHAESSEGN